jgi:hypothetical protein
LTYSRSNNSPSTTFFITSWDGGLIGGNLGVDLTLDGADAFQIDVLSLFGSASLWVTLADSNGNASRAFFEGKNGTFTTGQNTIRFSDLLPLLGTPAADLTSIDNINIRFSGKSTVLANLKTVPEPSTALFLSMGLVTMSVFRRRMRSVSTV